MSHFSSSEPELMKAVLGPLLEDFDYWFSSTAQSLRTIPGSQSGDQPGGQPGNQPQGLLDQQSLLQRLDRAQAEVNAARSLLQATDGQAGIDPAILAPWHQLVLECWQAGRLSRQTHQS